MKNALKKIFAVLLSIIAVFSLFTVSFAAQEVTPVIIVSGMNSFPLTLAETGEQVWPIQSSSILSVIKDNALPLTRFLVTKDWQYLGDEVIEDVYKALFEKVACDENGDSVNDIVTKTFPKSVDNYTDDFENSELDSSERGIVKSLIKEIGGENVYYFNYDWRLSPMKHADSLNDFICNIKKEKGCDKVTLIPCSMGGTVANAYLYKYGNESINKIIYTMAAIQGLSSVGEMFSRGIDVDVSTVMNYVFSLNKDDLKMQIVMALLNTAVEINPVITNFADDFIDESLSELNDRIYDELMIKSMGSFAGWWALVPDEYYDNAKETFFGGKITESFENVIDSYHYNVNSDAKAIMQCAAQSSSEIYVIASYGFVGAPYTDQAMTQTDCLIETHYQSGRAITAPYGKPFGEDYEAVGSSCSDKSHNHVSVDGIVDASSCFLPENTWFIKYNNHVGMPCDSDCEKLMLYLVTSDSCVTVHSNVKFPQFVELNRLTGTFSSLTGENIKTDIKDCESNFITRFVIIADTFIKNIKMLLS